MYNKVANDQLKPLRNALVNATILFSYDLTLTIIFEIIPGKEAKLSISLT